MNLAAKASAEAGYAMAALLVGMAVMAVMLSVAMPTWSQMIRREKEEELIFRGTQYARAFALYQSKFANASPANLDVLVEQRMLRKKFKDPMSPNKDGEFALLYMSNQPQGAAGGGFGGSGALGGTRGAGAGRGTVGAPSPGAVVPNRGGPAGASTAESGGATYTTQASGPIMGVASKNTGASIKVYKGKKRYNEWYFVGREGGAGGAGGAGGPAGGIGGRGGPPGGRGGREGGFPGSTNRGGFGGGRGSQGGFGGRGGDGGGFPGGGRGPMPSPPR